MGLFNRNKGDAPAPSTSEAGTTPPDTFDFDAISRDLDAQNGASSFDSLLAAPVNNAQQPAAAGGDSAFDFPENDPLGLSTPPTATPLTGTAPIATSPDAVINAPMSPSSSPVTSEAPAMALPPIDPPKAKKSLPLVPLLGALGLLAVAGGGAMFLLNSNQTPESDAPAVSPPALTKTPPKPVGEPPAPGTAVAPGVPGVLPETAPGGPGGMPADTHSASPGIAPPPAPKQTLPAPGSSKVPVSVGQAPGTSAPSATAGLDPQLALKLKTLWKAGANAKHKGDYKNGARRMGRGASVCDPDILVFRMPSITCRANVFFL